MKTYIQTASISLIESVKPIKRLENKRERRSFKNHLRELENSFNLKDNVYVNTKRVQSGNFTNYE